MFKKKNPIVEVPKAKSKEEQLGPKPADIPHGLEMTTFHILLKYSLPSIEVQAHTHDFGTNRDCGGGGGRFTHFYIQSDTTWVEDREYFEYHHRWVWKKDQPTKVVFSIRTDDIVMVVAKDNFTPVTTETLALEPRSSAREPHDWVRGPIDVAPDVY